MNDKEKCEMSALRIELQKAVEKTIEQKVEIMRLNILVKNLRALTNTMGSEATGSEYGSLNFPGKIKDQTVEDAQFIYMVVKAVGVAIDNNLCGIRTKIKEA